MNIAYVTNAAPASGVGTRAVHVKAGLTNSGLFTVDDYRLDGEARRVYRNDEVIAQAVRWPGALGAKSITWIRLGRAVRDRLTKADLLHATNQTLSFLAKYHERSIVTVHDIIEVIEPQSQGAAFLNRYLLSGIPRAAHLIAVSEYTKRSIQEHYGIDGSRITVIYNGVNPDLSPIEKFSETVAYQTLRAQLRLAPQERVILYVGSEHPRKNVVGVLEVFARIRQQHPEVVLVKVGEPGLPAGRVTLLETMDRLKVRDQVRLIGTVTTERLQELYAIADVFLYPSRFEGFGLPPLEAMACGVPVVTSTATSIPEVVGDAASAFDPDDYEGMAAQVVRLLESEQEREMWRKRGFERAQQFSWEKAVQREVAVYQSVLNR